MKLHFLLATFLCKCVQILFPSLAVHFSSDFMPLSELKLTRMVFFRKKIDKEGYSCKFQKNNLLLMVRNGILIQRFTIIVLDSKVPFSV